MDRHITPDSHTLHRIAAVLLALADLAERAAGRSAVVRGLILWLLRSGETLARDYAPVLTWDAAAQPEPLRLTRDSAAEATRLATSFRQLAATLTALAADSPAPSPQHRTPRFATLATADLRIALGTWASAVQRRDSS